MSLLHRKFPRSTSSSSTAPLAGNRVLLTGAGGALGSRTAAQLAREGAVLVLVDRDQAALDALVAALPSGTDTSTFAVDLLDDESLDGMVDEVLASGPVDALVTSHGIEINARFDRLDRARLDTQLGIHLRSPMLLIQRLVPHMLERGSGRIVVVSSLNGKLPFPGKVPYAAAKAGAIAMVHALRRDFAETPLRFSVVLPGLVAGEGQAARALESAGVTPPRAVPVVSIDACADAIMDALRSGTPEITVGSAASRVMPALQWVAPSLADTVLARFGVLDFWRRVSRGDNGVTNGGRR